MELSRGDPERVARGGREAPAVDGLGAFTLLDEHQLEEPVEVGGLLVMGVGGVAPGPEPGSRGLGGGKREDVERLRGGGRRRIG